MMWRETVCFFLSFLGCLRLENRPEVDASWERGERIQGRKNGAKQKKTKTQPMDIRDFLIDMDSSIAEKDAMGDTKKGEDPTIAQVLKPSSS